MSHEDVLKLADGLGLRCDYDDDPTDDAQAFFYGTTPTAKLAAAFFYLSVMVRCRTPRPRPMNRSSIRFAPIIRVGPTLDSLKQLSLGPYRLL